MNKQFFLASALLSVLLLSCNIKEKGVTEPNEHELIELDNIPALKNKKALKLSALVDHIEYIKLETKSECLIARAWRIVGEKYIVLANENEVLLFNRKGSFIRKIGNKGHGPGEYDMPYRIDLSPNEKKIIISDRRFPRLYEFDINGNHLNTHVLDSDIVQNPYFLDEKTLVLMQGRPFTDSAHFPRVITYNLESKAITPILHIDFIRDPDRVAGLYMSNEFSRNDFGVQFRDCMQDTLYHIGTDQVIDPLVTFDIGENTWPSYKIRMENDIYDNVGRIHSFPNHLLIIGSYKKRFHQIYDKNRGELYTLPEISDCPRENGYSYGVLNDLDGLQPYWPFSETYIRNNSIVTMHQMIDLKDRIETDCFNESELVSDKYRDQLRKLVVNSEVDDNPIIRVLHLK